MTADMRKKFIYDQIQEIKCKELIEFVAYKHKYWTLEGPYRNWLTMANICFVSNIRYNFIGKIETLIKYGYDLFNLTKFGNIRTYLPNKKEEFFKELVKIEKKLRKVLIKIWLK